MDEVAIIKGDIAIWVNMGTTWYYTWMNKRYVIGRGMEEIGKVGIDSADWKSILGGNLKIRRCVDLVVGNQLN